MSKDFALDLKNMHSHYGVNEKVAEFDKDKLAKFLEFRINFLQEELDELKEAKTADDVVDALIDGIVIGLGTLDSFQIDPYLAWDRVLAANMNKSVGIKASRPNVLGLPDLIKGPDWVAPTHGDNVGLLHKLY